jgi:putative transposase
VFVTKYRRGVFNAQMLTRCEQVMREVCQDFGADLREFNGEEDHVHLLVHYPPAVAISRLVNSLKGVSSRRLREENVGRTNRAAMPGHFWSPSYFAGSCGGAPLAVVKDYIAQQKRPD